MKLGNDNIKIGSLFYRKANFISLQMTGSISEFAEWLSCKIS